jgi:hypothetical protein
VIERKVSAALQGVSEPMDSCFRTGSQHGRF